MKMIVEAYERGLRFRDGRFVELLEPGRYPVARFLVKERIEKVDLRLRTLVLTGQELMTADKVTVRLSALVGMRIVDPVAAVLKVVDAPGQLYGDVQLALRAFVGALELDTLLAEKARLGDTVRGAVAMQAQEYGVEIVNVGVRDLVLPGEMKAILNQVMEARKKAEAAVILRREEVAATRSLANTAQLLEKNPVLMRLKEFEALEKIAGRGASLVIAPEMFGLMKEVLQE